MKHVRLELEQKIVMATLKLEDIQWDIVKERDCKIIIKQLENVQRDLSEITYFCLSENCLT